MLMPSILNDKNWFGDWSPFETLEQDFFGRTPSGRAGTVTMKTDIKESEDGYELSIDLPGFQKEEVSAELERGYLTITATKNEEKEDKDDQGKYLRRERYSGSCRRSFYVGDHYGPEDIQAAFENGVLKLTLPKKTKQIEEKKTITIG